VTDTVVFLAKNASYKNVFKLKKWCQILVNSVLVRPTVKTGIVHSKITGTEHYTRCCLLSIDLQLHDVGCGCFFVL